MSQTDTRADRLRELLDYYGLDPKSTDSTGDEDAGRYFLPESDEEYKPIREWAAVTKAGDSNFVAADFDSRADAQRGSTMSAGDSIYAEMPHAIVNLDTGEQYMPRWESLQWRKTK